MEWTNAAGCWIDGRRVSFRAYAYQETGLGSGERMGCAEGEVCPTNSFPALMLRPGLETRETRGMLSRNIRLQQRVLPSVK